MKYTTSLDNKILRSTNKKVAFYEIECDYEIDLYREIVLLSSSGEEVEIEGLTGIISFFMVKADRMVLTLQVTDNE